MSPAVFHAQQHPWGFFCTLTFAGKVPPPAQAYALQKRWMDAVAGRILHAKPHRLEWLSREELGEANGRFHLHVLLGKTHDAARMNPKTCLALMSEWEKVTAKSLGSAAMARIRVFDSTMQGVDYVLKGLDVDGMDVSLRGANAYEVGKFSGGENRTVRLARSLAVRWSGKKGFKYSLHARERRDAHQVKCEL